MVAKSRGVAAVAEQARVHEVSPVRHLVGRRRRHDLLRGIGERLEGDPAQELGEEAGPRLVVVHVAGLDEGIVRAQERDDVAQVLVGGVRELDHPGRRVAAVPGDPRAEEVRDLAVRPRADPLHRVRR